jgi:hypothetical protein
MKKSSVLSLQEINDLIGKYNSELRKLEYQAGKIQEALFELQSMLGMPDRLPLEAPRSVDVEKFETLDVPAKSSSGLPMAEQAPVVRKRRGRKPKAANEKIIAEKGKKKTGGKEKKTGTPSGEKKPGYRLSQWDTFLLDTLADAGTTLINSELNERAQAYARNNGMDMSASDISGKLSRSIHKLANRRGVLVKMKYPGKGYAYALLDWIDEQGELLPRFQRDWSSNA